jgi:hypothetical protein
MPGPQYAQPQMHVGGACDTSISDADHVLPPSVDFDTKMLTGPFAPPF